MKVDIQVTAAELREQLTDLQTIQQLLGHHPVVENLQRLEDTLLNLINQLEAPHCPIRAARQITDRKEQLRTEELLGILPEHRFCRIEAQARSKKDTQPWKKISRLLSLVTRWPRR